MYGSLAHDCQRCAVGIPKEFLFLGIPRNSRDFQKGGRNSRPRIKLMRTRINLNQRIVALLLEIYYCSSNSNVSASISREREIKSKGCGRDR